MDVQTAVAAGGATTRNLMRITVLVFAAPMLLQGHQAAPSTVVAGSVGKQFEVASVKPNKSGVTSSMNTTQPGGRYLANNVDLDRLIMAAYLLDSTQLVGGPAWIHTDRFDVSARAAEEIVPFAIAGTHTTSNPSPAQQMLRALLADRFKLVVHTERREQPAYALVLARSDRRLGTALTPSTADCTTPRPNGVPIAPPSLDVAPLCGLRVGPGSRLAGGVTMLEFTFTLARLTERVVIDRTGLAGKYDVRLSWTSEPNTSAVPGANSSASAQDGPSIFTALQEQLGLKLESTRAPVDVVVIDRAEPPSPD